MNTMSTTKKKKKQRKFKKVFHNWQYPFAVILFLRIRHKGNKQIVSFFVRIPETTPPSHWSFKDLETSST